MFGATTLSGSVVYGSQRSAYSFTIWIGNFGVQDSTYLPGSETGPFRRQKASSCFSPSALPQSRGFCEDGEPEEQQERKSTEDASHGMQSDPSVRVTAPFLPTACPAQD
jgi:hypothetical protein